MLDLLTVVVAFHALLAHLGALFAIILALQRRRTDAPATAALLPATPSPVAAPEIEAMRVALLCLQHENANLHARLDRVLDHLCLHGGAVGSPVDHAATPITGMEAAEAPPAVTPSAGVPPTETTVASAPTTTQESPQTPAARPGPTLVPSPTPPVSTFVAPSAAPRTAPPPLGTVSPLPPLNMGSSLPPLQAILPLR